MTPTTEITATLFEVAAYEDSSVTVDAKIEIFVHGPAVTSETIDSVIELVAARLRSKMRAAVPK